MVIHDLDIRRVTADPVETYPPLIVNADTVLTSAITL